MTTTTLTIKERPILFSAPMVRAILKGRKTQTRRIIKPQPPEGTSMFMLTGNRDPDGDAMKYHAMAAGPGLEVPAFYSCPYGVPGDQLWVKETWAALSDATPETAKDPGADALAARGFYAADWFPDERKRLVTRWRPSIHMSRVMSRITLQVTCVRVERVRDISRDDAIAEGFADGFVDLTSGGEFWTAQQNFLYTFFHLNQRAPEDANPWVWVIDFKRI